MFTKCENKTKIFATPILAETPTND